MKRLPVAAALIAALAALFMADSAALWRWTTLAVILLAAWEWGRLASLRVEENIFFAIFCAAAAVAADGLLAGNESARDAFFAAALFVWITAAPLLLLAKKMPQRFFLACWGMVSLPAAWLAAAVMYEETPRVLAAAIGMVALADAAAWAAGKLFGAQRLTTVSPGKTWEGLVGGALAVGGALTVMRAAEVVNGHIPFPLLLSMAFSLVALALLGDLWESLMKRTAGAKDSGGVLPGHGGVLDRLDAFLPSLPFVALVAPWLAL